MKFSIITRTAVPLLALGVLFQSCEKTVNSKLTEKTDFSNSATAQVFVATVNASRNYVYVDGSQVNGSALTSGSIFPASGPGFNVSPGIKGFLVRDTLGTTTQVPLSFAENMQFGKNYTVFMYDTITTPKQKTVQTDIVIPSDTTARIRFANFVYNPTIVPAIDVFSFNRNANIFTNVAVTDVTSFIPYPSRIGTDTLYIRETGTTVNILKLSISNLVEKRSYTLIYRGSHRGTRVGQLFLNR